MVITFVFFVKRHVVRDVIRYFILLMQSSEL